jgi:SSS family solute:Na+ symporter
MIREDEHGCAERPDHRERVVGFVKSVTPKAMLEDPKEKELPWYRRTVPLGMLCLGLVIILNLVFH